MPGMESADDLSGVAQQGNSGGGPLRGFEHAGERVGGCGGQVGRRRRGCRRGRSESEGHGPPFGYAPTLRAGVLFRGAHAAAEPYRTTDEPCGERTSILPAELGCGNEQLGPLTETRRCAVYIPTQCVASRRMSRPFTPSWCTVGAEGSKAGLPSGPAVLRGGQLWTARTRGNTPCAPARRSMRAATASVQPVSVKSSTRRTGPPASATAEARAGGTVSVPSSAFRRCALL